MPSYKDSARPPVIALTGGIGSGKSTVAALLAAHGAYVIDADKVAHQAYRPGSEGFTRIIACFGGEILATDGSIDRQKLGALVFADSNARQRLNSIVHPLVAREMATLIAAKLATGFRNPIVLEIPLLVETKGMWAVDQVWVVAAEKKLVVERLIRRGLSEAAVKARMESQAADEERLMHANVVIANNGTIEELETKVLAEWQKLRACSN